MADNRMQRRGTVIAALPCYNEEKFIGEIIHKTRRFVDRVVVVDDGSTDGTSAAAELAGATVVRHQTNEGPGMAYQFCLQAADKYGAEFLVTLDGDGQHDPEELPRLLQPLLENQADFVIGSRFLTPYKIKRYRKFGIDVITFLYNLGAREWIVDAQSCYRAYNRKALDALQITEKGFGFSVELLVQARRRGLRICEVPISCIYTNASHSMNPVRHGVGVAWMVLKHRLMFLLSR